MSDNGDSQPSKPPFKRFVISLFGESGAGKTTVLGRLIEMLRTRARYNLEVAEGFQTHDLRSIMWYRTGRKYSGAVSVCTMGDTVEIIQKNFDFFEAHFNNQLTAQITTPWSLWEKEFNQELTEVELQSTTKHGAPIGVLVTASRKPLGEYKKLRDRLKGYAILNIPIRVDVWHESELDKPTDSRDWMTSVRAIPELLLFHVNHVLRYNQFKKYVGKRGYRVNFAALSSSVSRD